MLEIILGGLGVAILGSLVGFLIKLGRHDKEHDVIKIQLEDVKSLLKEEMVDVRGELMKHDERLDRNDVNFSAIMTSLDYITKKLDGQDGKIDYLIKERRNDIPGTIPVS